MKHIGKIVAVCLLFAAIVAVVDAQSYFGGAGGRRYYGYQSHNYYGPYWGKSRNYYTYYYNYRPTPASTSYSYHTAYYYPKTVGSIQGGYYYYRNRVTGKYWGRCYAGSSNYELLAENKRSPNLEDIAEGDFEKQGKMPPVPEMQPKTPLIPPPPPTKPPEE